MASAVGLDVADEPPDAAVEVPEVGSALVVLEVVGAGALAGALGCCVADGVGVADADDVAQLADPPSALLVAQRLDDTPVPTEPAPIIVTSEMPATITPYSTDVTPRCERARNPNMRNYVLPLDTDPSSIAAPAALAGLHGADRFYKQ